MLKKMLKLFLMGMALLSLVACGSASINGSKKVNSSVKMGETVIFGTYNDKPIEWLVIDREEKEKKLLLFSKNCIDFCEYSKTGIKDYGGYANYENSFIRTWLKLLYDKSFSDNEKLKILNTDIETEFYDNYENYGKWDRFDTIEERFTSDEVFLLSFEEYDKYRQLYDFNLEKIDNNTEGWYLRDRYIGERSRWNPSNQVIKYEDASGESVLVSCSKVNGVRPAIWVKY